MESRPNRNVFLALVLAAGCAGYAAVEHGESPSNGSTTPTTAREGGGETAVVAVEEPTPVAGPTAHPPIQCAGQERIAAAGVVIDNPASAAIRASGQCVVELTDAMVSGSDYGVEATGNARVVLTNSRVTGGEAAVVSAGNATVELPGTEVVGEVRVQGADAGGGRASVMGMSAAAMGMGG